MSAIIRFLLHKMMGEDSASIGNMLSGIKGGGTGDSGTGAIGSILSV
jgi:hypothetical protein